MNATTSLNVIERKIKQLQAEAEEIRRNEREGVEQLRAVIKNYKLGPAHIRMAMSDIGTQASTRVRPKLKPVPKYRNPDNEAAVWSGRGRRPTWLTAALNEGRTLDEFVIREGAAETSETPSAVN